MKLIDLQTIFKHDPSKAAEIDIVFNELYRVSTQSPDNIPMKLRQTLQKRYCTLALYGNLDCASLSFLSGVRI